MAVKRVTYLCQEEEKAQMSHSMELSSQIKKRKFKSSEDEVSLSEFYPIIPGDIMSVKEILTEPKFPRHRTWEVLRETMDNDELRERDQWTMFGNEAEKLEIEVIRDQHMVRQRVDRMVLRKEAERKLSRHLKFLDDLSMKSPDFSIPLRAHVVWEGMAVKLSCTVEGCPSPHVTWYKDGVPLTASSQPWNYKLLQKYGLNTLEIRRCTATDAGEYKVVAKSSLGEATTYATVVVNSKRGFEAGMKHTQTRVHAIDEEALFDASFAPSFIKEGDTLSLSCSFTVPLLPFQQDVAWFRDGVPLRACGRLDIHTALRSSTLSLKGMHKEHEGLYTVRLRTQDGITEHSAYIYVKDGPATVRGAPGSPLQLKCSDVNRDYVFLSWEPPSAEGAGPVEGYIIERCEVGKKWERCNELVQKLCHYPVMGLKENTMYQFRVCAVNQAGVGRPSKTSDPIVTSDPMEPSRTMVVKVDRGREIVITKDQLESQIRVPFPPTDVRVCELSDTYVVMCWTEPDPRGKEPLSYYVERSIDGKESWHMASLDMTINSTRFAAFDLEKGVAYCFRVRSVNKYGVSDPSEPSQPVSLGEPLGVPAAPHCVQAFRDTDRSILLKWKEPKSTEGILGYYLYCSELGSSEWKTINNKPVKTTRFLVHGLRTSKQYVFRVKSVGRAGNSRYSDESEPILVHAAKFAPSAPSAISLLHCTGTEMVISWRAPVNNGGDLVRGYYLDQREKTQSTWREVNVKAVKERLYTVPGLLEGHYYQFRVIAANMVGVGKPSGPSEAFLCEKWTMPEPGCPYDLELREVRQESLVLLWAEPLYQGQSEIIGYVVEMSEGMESEDWTAVTQEPITDTHLKVSGLQAGHTYRLRVCAINSAGVGRPSLPTDPVTVQTDRATKDIEIGVDNDGFIFLSFEAPETIDQIQFDWKKNYKQAIDAGRAHLETKQNKSVLTFNAAAAEDLGLYTADVIGRPDISSSFNFTAEDLERLMELSWNIRNPLIALRSEGWQVDVLEQGNVRLWLQTEPLSNAAELHMILNDKEISSTPTRKINFDKANGLVEILFDQLTKEDEGSYTAQLKDGRAKNQFTLVLVDEKFRQTLAKSEAKRWDWKRRSGPYFEEFLSWSVTEDCELVMKCKVTNMSKDTKMKWFKDGIELKQFVFEASGVATVTVSQVTKKEVGTYRVVVADGRGEDQSILDFVDNEFERLMQSLSKNCALSASPMRIQCTATGFRLYCSLKYYLSYMKTSWYFKEKRIDQEERTKPGSSMQKVWIDIFNPTENDKGRYTLEMFDGQETHKRTLDLSGQAFADALLEYQRLKEAAIAEKNRAKVTKGLPDVVAIMEDKSLCLTCFAEGNPDPEMFWLKNDREIVSEGRFNIARDNGRTTLTIYSVCMEDSGNYSVFVRNKYGSQTVHVTVSVYKHGEIPQAGAFEM
ncbi:myomesin-3 [Clarias gariepinus]